MASKNRCVKQAASKRFRRTGSGAFKRYCAGKRHYLTKRSSKNKRQLRLGTLVHTSDHGRVQDALGLS